MDTYASVGATSGILSLVGVVGYGLYKLLVHSHCRSACCTKPLFDLYVNLDEREGDRTITLPKNSSPPRLPAQPLSPAKRQTG